MHACGKDTTVQALAENWPDENTQQFLRNLALKNPSAATRGFAFAMLARQQSDFGRVVSSLDLDGKAPYRDPLAAIPREQIEAAANQTRIPPCQIDASLADLSRFLGWNITLALAPPTAPGNSE